ncbi:hypothetical protein [Streptomyces sp. NPDC057616]|uniref:hypothetical protein n=1 Tax=Streptomyces sp. NPDC057616 TaxID=3346183 RepID=UPI0036770A44
MPNSSSDEPKPSSEKVAARREHTTSAFDPDTFPSSHVYRTAPTAPIARQITTTLDGLPAWWPGPCTPGDRSGHVQVGVQ